MKVTVRDLLQALESAFPTAWAEPWDRVGLLVGDPDATVQGVFVTLDATHHDLAAAREAGANVLLTHHPAFLSAPDALAPGSGTGGLAFAAAATGTALIAAHTNLDRAPAGAASLAAALGLPPGEPVESSAQPVSLVTVFVPGDALETVSSAMARAGAGRIGLYEGCSFSASGTGRFTPLAGAVPRVGAVSDSTARAEERLEMVCAPGETGRVIEAARAAHPYEEPLVLAAEGSMARGAARLGRVCELSEPLTLKELARRAEARFGTPPRVWGDRDARIVRVATATGSAGSLIGDVRASGADALVAGEVRYHDALNASRAGLGIVELGHDISEWPLVPILAEAVRPACAGIPLVVDTPRSAWWTP